ncbi:2-succinylbenzoate--CoA ligase [Halobacillus andaensis]|uniref:2-succinylbenzoate--CoA ligase n=1 Tax=Halobacillus andaensis TaxID=1176239 RepID=A0A917B9X7_HALAA|nr:o-succinylbenzoate--CoA ligase [Halobacillus andaensis]MBP2005620.1 O-succinylbenzoic acid--CoA ligase [Halobacillus andaensis]GGF32929.1 2-succinylbenzoate--CoA ligase [Halobacillus andaensis]
MIEIPHWLEKQYDLQPDSIAIEMEGDRSITFKELRDYSRKLASGLLNRGIKSGDHVAFLSANHLDYVLFIHAISYVGAVAVCLNIRLSASELAFQIEDSNSCSLVVDEQNKMLGEQSMDESQADIDLLMVEQLTTSEEKIEVRETLRLDEYFTMMYTSGTTGKPKAVMHTYGNHWFSAIASALNLGLTDKDKWLVCLPLFHVGGFSLLMKNVIYGMPIILLDKFDAEVVNRKITHHQVSLVSVVTVMLQRLLKDKKQAYPSTFRGALLGGGPVPAPLLREAFESNISVFQTYGMTETSSQISTLRPSDAFQKLGSAGKALTPASLKIRSGGKPCAPNEIGEIHVKGPMVSSGYYRHSSHENEYLATGDLGYVDEDGFLYVIDRVKDMLISGGENVYPAEIESVLLEVDGVQEAAVTGIEHPEWGEVPIAFVVTRNGYSVTEGQIQKYCKKRLAGFKVPVSIKFIEEIPRNASNKIVRRKLHSLIEKGENREHK